MFGFLKKILGSDEATLKNFYDQEAIILDVRTPQEYQTGHVAGSINIPLQVLGKEIRKVHSFNKPVITCCASGIRSATAARQLKAAGIKAINGGSWKSLQQS